MAQYSRTVLTDAGVILARRMMDETITMEFTRIVTGDGQYSSGEDLAARTALKSPKQSFPLSSRSLTDEDRVLHLKYVISNVNPDSSPLTVGYYVREVGIYAHVTGESEILYAVAIADADAADYLPEYDELQPSTITMDWFITVGNTENITIQASPSAYALAEDLEELALVVDEKLDADGDSKNNTISFTSSDEADSDVTKSTGWATVAPLESGETHESFMTKFSKIVKNLRWLYKLIGTTDISSIGDGTVTKALSVLNANDVKSITRSGTTFTVTRNDNTNFTFTQQDTTYGLASTTANGLLRQLNGNTAQYMRGDGTWQTPPNTNTWKQNTSAQEGYVVKGVANKVWKCDASGNPAWRDDANTTYGLASTSANGLLRQLDNNADHFLCGQGTWKAPITATEIGHISGKGSGHKLKFNPGNYKIIIIHGWIIDIGVSFTGFGPYIIASQQRKYTATGGYNTPTYPGPWMLFYIDSSGIYISEVRSNGNDVADNQTGFYVYGINWT